MWSRSIEILNPHEAVCENLDRRTDKKPAPKHLRKVSKVLSDLLVRLAILLDPLETE